MEVVASKFEKYIFVCENERAGGEACCMPGGQGVREALKNLVKARGLSGRIRVSRAGCLDACADGPSVLIMPDNLRLKRVAVGDVDKILDVVSRDFSGGSAESANFC